MMSHPRRRSPESSRRRRKARRDSRGQSVVNDDASRSIVDQRGEYASTLQSTMSAPYSPYPSHEQQQQQQPSASPRPQQQHPDGLAPITMRSNDHTPNLSSIRSMPVPIPADLNRPHREKNRRGSGSSSERTYSSSNGSSSSSSYLDISRWYPSYRRSGGVVRAFFQTPSEHRPRRRNSGRRKPKKAKPTIFGFGNNSSSSSVNSDMAYGMGFLRKNKSRSGGNRSHGSGTVSATAAGYRRETSDGRPATLQRRQTDEEILEIGRKLAEVARKQNREDLRTSGKRTPSHLMATAGVWERYHRESSSAIEGSSQRNVATALDVHHHHRREEPSDWEDWESASDNDEGSIESDSNSALAYGHTELHTPQPALSSIAGRNASLPDPRDYEAGKSTVVDPKLFGPSNSLHDFVNTPCGFNDGRTSYTAPDPLNVKYAGSAESASIEARPMQRVFPLSTSDPNLVEAARGSGSLVSAQQQYQQQSTTYPVVPSLSSRPEPIPIQAPVPIVPVPSRIFEEERLQDHAEPSEPSRERERHRGSFKNNPTFVETALVGAGVAALGTALLAGVNKSKGKEVEEVGHGRDERYGHEDKRADGTKMDDANKAQELSLMKEIERLERALGRTNKAREQRKRDSKRDSGGQPRELPEDDRTVIVADAARRDEEEREERRHSKSSRYSREFDEPRQRQIDVEDAQEGRGEDSKRIHGPSDDFDVFQYRVPDESFQSRDEALRASSPMIIDVTPSPSPAPGQSSRSRHGHMDEEEQEARHIYKEARHSTAPLPEAAMAAAIAATEHSRWHHEEEERGRSSTRTADHIQEAANQYYHARRIAEREQRSRSRSKSVDSEPSVVDNYRDDEDNKGKTIPRIVTPPEMAGRAKKNKYSEPDADVTFDNRMVPRQLLMYWPEQAPVRDHSAQRDRPVLNLVMPTPVPTPTPEKQNFSTAEATTRSPQDAAPSVVIKPNGEVVEVVEVIESPTTLKRVSWGPSETQNYVVESADEVSREPSPEGHFKSTGKKSSGGGWGTIAAAIVGASTAAAIASDDRSDKHKHGKQDVEEEAAARYHERSSGSRSPPKERPILPAGTSPRTPAEEPEEPPPMPSTKPPSPPRSSHMPGAFDEDIDFAATLAAGLEHSGFDPEIVIENPNYHRRDSPPGSNEDFSQSSYIHPFAETVSDLGVISFDDSSRSVSEPGYVLGEVADTPIDERHAPLTDPVLEAEWPEPASTTSPRRSKKEKRAADKTQAKSSPVDVEEDEWISAPSSQKSKKSKGKKSKRASVTWEDTESPINDRLVSASVEDSRYAQETPDDRDTPKQTRKSKRGSQSYDNDEPTDKDVASSVADSRWDDYSTVSSYKDASSTISAPTSTSSSKNNKSEKRNSGGGSIWGRLMGSSSNSNGDDKQVSKKDSAGTFGEGAGIAGVAAAIAALALSDAAEAPRQHEEEPHDFHRSLPRRSIDDLYDESSSFRRDSNLLEDPEVAPRQIKPAIDPQFGDLLPLPPSPGASTDSRIFVDYNDHEDLPALPDSRPGSPPGLERVGLRKRDDSLKRTINTAHSRRISSLEMAPRSPSHTAIPLQFRMSHHRSLPTTSGTRSSPVLQSPPTSASPELSPTLRKSQTRPTSWDNSREYKPLYLLEQARSEAKRIEPEFEEAGNDSTAAVAVAVAAAAATAAAAVALDKGEPAPAEAEAEERQVYPLKPVSKHKFEPESAPAESYAGPLTLDTNVIDYAPVESQEDPIATSQEGEHASHPSPVENQPTYNDTIPSPGFIEQTSPILAEPVIAVQNELALASLSSLPESTYATPVGSPTLAPFEEQRERVLEESNEDFDMFVTPQPILEGQDLPAFIPAEEVNDVQHVPIEDSDFTVVPGKDSKDGLSSAEPAYNPTSSLVEEDVYPPIVEATDLPVSPKAKEDFDPSVAFDKSHNIPLPVETDTLKEKEVEILPSPVESAGAPILREAEEYAEPHSELAVLGILPASERFSHENIYQSSPIEAHDIAESMGVQRDEENHPPFALPDESAVLPEAEKLSGYASAVEPSGLPAFVEVEEESRLLPAQPEDIPLPVESEDEYSAFLDDLAATKPTEPNDNHFSSAEIHDLPPPKHTAHDDVYAYPVEPYNLPEATEAVEEPTSPHFPTSLPDDSAMPKEVETTEHHPSSAIDLLPVAAMIGAGVLLGREIAGHHTDVADNEPREAAADDQAPDQPTLPLEEESQAHVESETASRSEPVDNETSERAVHDPEVVEPVEESSLPLQTPFEAEAGSSEPIYIAETDIPQAVPAAPTDAVDWATEPVSAKGKKGKKKKKNKKGSVSAAAPPQTAPIQFDEVVSLSEYSAMRQQQEGETPAAKSMQEEVPADVDLEEETKHLAQKQQSSLPAEGAVESVQPGSEAELPASVEEFATPLESFVESSDPTQSVLVDEPSQMAAAGDIVAREPEFAETIDSRAADVTVDPVFDTVAQETTTQPSLEQPDATREVDEAPATSYGNDEWMTTSPSKSSKKNKKKKNKRQSSNLSKGSIDHGALAAAAGAAAASAIAIGSLADEKPNDNNQGQREVTSDAIPTEQQPGDGSVVVPETPREVAGADEVQEMSAASAMQPLESDKEQHSHIDAPGLSEEPTLPLPPSSLIDDAKKDDSDKDTMATQETPFPLEEVKGLGAESAVAEPTLEPHEEAPRDKAIVDEPIFDEPAVADPTLEPNEEAPRDKAIVDEPIFDEPAVVEPTLEPKEEGSNDQVVDEPVLAKPGVEEPAFNERGPVESAFLEPTMDKPDFEEPTFEEVITEKATADEPFAKEHAFVEPGNDGPAVNEHFVHEPAISQHSFLEAAAEEPVIDEPASIDEPTVHEPSVIETASIEAAILEPAIVDEPTVYEPTVYEPSVVESANIDEPINIDEPTNIDEPAIHEPSVVETANIDEPASTDEPAIIETAIHEPAIVDEPTVHEPSVVETVMDKYAVDEPVPEAFATEWATVDKSLPDEPIVDEPIVDEPIVDEPVLAENIHDHTAIIESTIGEPVVDEPALLEAAMKGPISEKVAVQRAAVDESDLAEHATNKPVPLKTILDEPAFIDTALDEPAVSEPILGQPTFQELATEKPIVDEPIPEEHTLAEHTPGEFSADTPRVVGSSVANVPVENIPVEHAAVEDVPKEEVLAKGIPNVEHAADEFTTDEPAAAEQEPQAFSLPEEPVPKASLSRKTSKKSKKNKKKRKGSIAVVEDTQPSGIASSPAPDEAQEGAETSLDEVLAQQDEQPGVSSSEMIGLDLAPQAVEELEPAQGVQVNPSLPTKVIDSQDRFEEELMSQEALPSQEESTTAETVKPHAPSADAVSLHQDISPQEAHASQDAFAAPAVDTFEPLSEEPHSREAPASQDLSAADPLDTFDSSIKEVPLHEERSRSPLADIPAQEAVLAQGTPSAPKASGFHTPVDEQLPQEQLSTYGRLSLQEELPFEEAVLSQEDPSLHQILTSHEQDGVNQEHAVRQPSETAVAPDREFKIPESQSVGGEVEYLQPKTYQPEVHAEFADLPSAPVSAPEIHLEQDEAAAFEPINDLIDHQPAEEPLHSGPEQFLSTEAVDIPRPIDEDVRKQPEDRYVEELQTVAQDKFEVPSAQSTHTDPSFVESVELSIDEHEFTGQNEPKTFSSADTEAVVAEASERHVEEDPNVTSQGELHIPSTEEFDIHPIEHGYRLPQSTYGQSQVTSGDEPHKLNVQESDEKDFGAFSGPQIQNADKADSKSQHAATEATRVDTVPVSEYPHELKDVSSQPQDTVFEENTEVEAPLDFEQRARSKMPVEDDRDDNNVTLTEDLPGLTLPEQEPLTVDFESSRVSDEQILESTSAEPLSAPKDSRLPIVAEADNTTASDLDEESAAANAPVNITAEQTYSPEWPTTSMSDNEQPDLSAPVEARGLSEYQRQVNNELGDNDVFETAAHAHGWSPSPVVDDVLDEPQIPSIPLEPVRDSDIGEATITSRDDALQEDHSVPTTEDVSQINDNSLTGTPSEITQEKAVDQHIDSHRSEPLHDTHEPSYAGFGDPEMEPVSQDISRSVESPVIEHALPEATEAPWASDSHPADVMPLRSSTHGDDPTPTLGSPLQHDTFPRAEASETEEISEQARDVSEPSDIPVVDIGPPKTPTHENIQAQEVEQSPREDVSSEPIPWAVPDPSGSEDMPQPSRLDSDDERPPALSTRNNENEDVPSAVEETREIHDAEYATPRIEPATRPSQNHALADYNQASDYPVAVQSQGLDWVQPAPSPTSTLRSITFENAAPNVSANEPELQTTIGDEDDKDIIASEEKDAGSAILDNGPSATDHLQDPRFGDKQWTDEVSEPWAFEATKHNEAIAESDPGAELHDNTAMSIKADSSWHGDSAEVPDDTEGFDMQIESPIDHHGASSGSPVPMEVDDGPSSDRENDFLDVQRTTMRPESPVPWEDHTLTLATPADETFVTPAEEVSASTFITPAEEPTVYFESSIPAVLAAVSQFQEPVATVSRKKSKKDKKKKKRGGGSSGQSVDFGSTPTTPAVETPAFEEGLEQQDYEAHKGQGDLSRDVDMDIERAMHHHDVAKPAGHSEADQFPLGQTGREIEQTDLPDAEDQLREVTEFAEPQDNFQPESMLPQEQAIPESPTLSRKMSKKEKRKAKKNTAPPPWEEEALKVTEEQTKAVHSTPDEDAQVPSTSITVEEPLQDQMRGNSPTMLYQDEEPQDNFEPGSMLPQEQIIPDPPTLSRKMSKKEKRKAKKNTAPPPWEEEALKVTEEQTKAVHSTPDEDAPVPSTSVTVEEPLQDQMRGNSPTMLYRDEEPQENNSPPATDTAVEDTVTSPLSYQELNKDENEKGKGIEVPILERKELPLHQDTQAESWDTAAMTAVDYPELETDKFGDIIEATRRSPTGAPEGEETVEAGQSSLAIPGTELDNKKFRAPTPDIWDDDDYFKPKAVASGAASPNGPLGKVQLQPAFRSELDKNLDDRSKDERPLVGLGLIHRHSSIFQEDDRHTPKLLTMGLDEISVESMAANEVKPLDTPQPGSERSWDSPRSFHDEGKEQPASATASQLSQKSSVALLAEKFGGAKKGNVPRPTSMAPGRQAQVGDDNVSATNSQPDQDTEEFTPQTPGKAAGAEKVSLEPVVLGAGAHLGSEVVSGGFATQTLPTVNLPDGDIDEDMRQIDDVPIITTTDIDEPQSQPQDLPTPRSLGSASDSGSWHHRLDESALPAMATQDEEPRGMFTNLPRSLSRGLPPVREEPQEEEAGYEKPTTRLMAGRRSPELNRDSGVVAESPLASWARRLNNAQQRDSGVQMRDDRAPSPRHSPGSQRLSPISIEGDSKVDEYGKQSPRSINDARNFFLDNPYILGAHEQPVTPEPEKSLKARGRVRKYPDVSPDTAALTGGAALAALLVGRRSISPTFPSDPADFNPPSPKETQETQPPQRRMLSNTGVSRSRTPEPLNLRPESPGLLRYPGVAIGAPPLRSRRSRSGDLRTLSQSSQHSQSDLGATASPSGAPGAPSRQRSPAPSSRSPTPAAAAPTPVPASISSTSDLRKTAAAAAAAAAATSSSTSSSAASGNTTKSNTPSSTANKSSNPVANEGRVRSKDMADVYDGFGEGRMGSPRSPTRPHSMRRRQSMQVLELESRVEQLIAENRALNAAKDQAEQHSSNRTTSVIAERDNEIETLRQSLEFMRKEVQRLTEVNEGLNSAIAQSAVQHESRYRLLETQHAQTTKELDNVRGHHNIHGRTLEEKDAEIRSLREQLEATKEQIREMQRQILASKSADSDFLQIKDVDYFDHRCQQLCSHVQQWVLRFSKFSDMRACRLTSELNDEKIIDRLDNAVLDGSNVDRYLNDRVGRRDIFMSVTVTMIWEFVFTRYLFGMDREQRQKLKTLEKLLLEVGPPHAVRQWRAVTLTLLAKRDTFEDQREKDTEAVVQAVFQTLSMILPPPSNLEEQILNQLRKVMREAVDLSIQMRTQRAEYVMLPPLQPEYDANGDLAEPHLFNAALMSERSGSKQAGMDDDDLQAEGAIVRAVLFPLVVKKGDDDGKGDDEVVVCPAQVIVAKPRSASRRSMRPPSSDAGGISVLRGTSPSTAPNKSNVSMQSAEYIEGGF